MGTPAVGDVVVVPFPVADLSGFKRRPAVVVARVDRGDLVMCQITSRRYSGVSVIALSDASFATGGLSRDSFIRVGKVFTGSASLIVGNAGTLNDDTTSDLRISLRQLFGD